jgi:type I restriction enzyme R subunit
MYVDKRLAGIQAVQTLSRLNRAHPGKDTTYVVDFVNEPGEILEAFKTYYETAELSGDDRPEPRLDLRAKLDAPGSTTTYEVDRVVGWSWIRKNAKQSELDAALDARWPAGC